MPQTSLSQLLAVTCVLLTAIAPSDAHLQDDVLRERASHARTGEALASPAPNDRLTARVERAQLENVALPKRGSVCPPDMVLVDGQYCPNPKHECLRWLDDESLPFARCGDYAEPARCLVEREPLRFCIARYEYSAADEALPTVNLSFSLAKKLCAERGQRLCSEAEWNFACEGEEMRPYPYGFRRQPVCNQDKSDLVEMKDGSQVLRDQRAPHTAFPECQSPFGVFNMVGNVDEPVVRPPPYQPGFHVSLKGGWWMAGRNRCRPATRAHDDHFKGAQIGARCCADAGGSGPSAAKASSAQSADLL